MDQEYKPHIIGTNHLPYNVKKTIKHINSLDGTLKKLMLESYDPEDKGPSVEFSFGVSERGVEFSGARSNPNVFYGRLFECFKEGIHICFAYDPIHKIEIKDFDARIDDPVRSVEVAAAKFNERVNPIILNSVLEQMPDAIVIGNTHGRFLAEKIPQGIYTNVEDRLKGAIWTANLLRKGIFTYLKARRIYKRDYKNN